MSRQGEVRRAICQANLVVVKVGSSSLADPAGFLLPERLNALVDALAKRYATGRRMVLVSSGAQAAGMGPLGLTRRPRNLAEAQAAASVGQGLLMARYTEAFAAHGIIAAQVLLTSTDVIQAAHYRNANRALSTLLERGIVPIVNENDAVATDEIRFGDNDRLAALVAHLVHADALILLTDVDALYDAPPTRAGSRRIELVNGPGDLKGLTISGRGSNVGTGGMVAKVQAATLAASSGVPVLLTSAAQAEAVCDPARCDDPGLGTVFAATGRRISPKRLWLGYAAQTRGRLMVDAGAARAVVAGKSSLLAVGVVGVEGEFGPGEPVEVLDPTGRTIARGLAGYSSQDMRRIAGMSLHQIAQTLGAERAVEAIHRDELVHHARSRRPNQPPSA
ncbi:MAG: glutamate 5-kinase [Bifidobacteriaceae bacterium]|jgi:glutamate 5-kinase|nr:glutamate 5-kinase [Bifidobacteriaceae bacterium]